jgi:hypothetical protein
VWSLRKSARFLQQVQEAYPRTPRLVESIAGAEFVVARDPEQGMAVPGSRCRSWPVHPSEGVTYKIIYSFDSREVVFQALYPAIAPPGNN